MSHGRREPLSYRCWLTQLHNEQPEPGESDAQPTDSAGTVPDHAHAA
jgi:hypothetical protein